MKSLENPMDEIKRLKDERVSLMVIAGRSENLSTWQKSKVAEIDARLKELVAKCPARACNKAKTAAKAKRRSKKPYSPDISRFLQQ